MITKRHILLFSTLLIAACHNDPPVIAPQSSPQQDIRENMINANRTIAQSEETVIDEYVSRRGWPMKKLSNGTRLWEYVSGTGDKIDFEDSVSVRYSIEAVNGKTIYESVEERFVAGRRRDMIGIDEAILELRRGSKAKIILPSNLGYGIGGDGDRIPQSAILVIDIEVKS